MPYESRAELVARLAKIDTALDSARTAQSYATSGGNRLARADYQALREERDEVIAKIEAIDASTSGMQNKVKFARPT